MEQRHVISQIVLGFPVTYGSCQAIVQIYMLISCHEKSTIDTIDVFENVLIERSPSSASL